MGGIEFSSLAWSCKTVRLSHPALLDNELPTAGLNAAWVIEQGLFPYFYLAYVGKYLLFFVFIISHHTTNLGAQFLWIAQTSLFVYLCALFFRCGQYSGRSWNSRVKTMPHASRFYAGVNMQAAKLSICGFIYEIMCSEGKGICEGMTKRMQIVMWKES